MSVGAAPLTDEDLLALQRPPQIVPPEPAPVEGPSPTPPDFIDRTNAQPLPAPVSGTNVDENAFPPPVPAEAPGAVSMPSPLPGAPPPVPGAPPSAKPPAGASPPNALAQADQDVRTAATGAATARENADQKQLEAVQGGAQQAHDEHNAAIDALANKQDEIDKTEALQAKYDKADQEAQQKIDETAKARKSFSFRSYWADKSSATRIGSALFQALGALGAGLTRGPNYALQILDKQMDDDHRDQVDQLQKLSDDEVRARTGLTDSREARKQALLGIQVNAAQGDAMIAAQLRVASAKSTDDNFKKQVDAFAAKLQEDSAQKLLGARMAVRTGILKEQDDAAKRAEQEARANLLNVQAAHGGFARVARGTGGGGGGSTSTVGANAEELAKRIREGHDGKPLTDDEIIHAATELHIPLAGKAGVVTLDKVRSVAKFDADAAIKARRAGVQDERLGDKEATEWAKSNGLDAINKKQRELGSLAQELKENPHDPLTQALAIEKSVSAARGGAASKQALALALDHMGSTLDKPEAFIAKVKSGEIGAPQMKNFIGFLNGQLGVAQREGKDKYDAYEKYVASQPEDKRAGLTAQRGRLFSGLAGFGGGAGGSVDEAKVARAKAATAPGSSATPAQRTGAEDYLRSVGRL